MRRSDHKHYRFIDGLRAIAVLGVIGFHCNLPNLSGGYAGVDVFFVLSGFLITGIIDAKLNTGTFSFAEFYERRCRRILPALFLTCVLCTVAAGVLFVPRDFHDYCKSLKGAVFFFSNAVYADSAGYFTAPASTKPLLHTWSLAVEEQFYLLFPPLIVGLHRFARGDRRLPIVAIGALAAASFAVSLFTLKDNPDAAFFLLPSRAWELFLGSLTALLLIRVAVGRIAAELLSAVGAIGIGLSFVLFDRHTAFPGYAALLPCVASVLLLWSSRAHDTMVARCLSCRPLVGIGLISYGLYLYHWPVLAFTRYFLDRDLNTVNTGLALAATACLAMLSYRLVESPVRTGRSMPARHGVFRFAMAGIAGIGAVGIIGVNADGFSARFSGAALQYASGAHDMWDWSRCSPNPDRLDERVICRIGSAGAASPSFLVWGDSHAAALEPAFDARAKALGIAGWYVGYPRCPALVGAAPMRRYAEDRPCQLVSERVVDIVRRNHIRTVVLVSRWDSYVNGWDRGGIETKQDLTIAYTSRDGRVTGEEALRRSLRDTVDTLRAGGSDVWIVEQVPSHLIDVPSALAKSVHFGRDPTVLRRPLSEVAQSRRQAVEVFVEVKQSPGVFLIDPAPYFCPDGASCLIAERGHALYSDANHLSVYGALWSQPMLDPLFDSLSRFAP